MSPQEPLQRLAALVSPPQLHLIRFDRVLAPDAKLQALAVPQGPPDHQETASAAAVQGPGTRAWAAGLHFAA
jgi:hypothetical protein